MVGDGVGLNGSEWEDERKIRMGPVNMKRPDLYPCRGSW